MAYIYVKAIVRYSKITIGNLWNIIYLYVKYDL